MDAATESAALLPRVREREPEATGRLAELLYGELRGLARGVLSGGGQSLQPTEPVHEAFLRLTRGTAESFKSRAHFLAVAAKAMRQVLIDRARRRSAKKRGAGERPLTGRGLVVEAFGYGNIPPPALAVMASACAAVVLVVATSRCRTGGFELRSSSAAGVVSGAELDAIKARTLLVVALGAGAEAAIVAQAIERLCQVGPVELEELLAPAEAGHDGRMVAALRATPGLALIREPPGWRATRRLG